MKPKESSRRRFLKNGVVFAGMAMGTAEAGRPLPAQGAEKADISPEAQLAYGERSHFEDAVRTPSGTKPFPFYVKQRLTPIQDSVGIITPSSLHFFNSHGYMPPDIDHACAFTSQ